MSAAASARERVLAAVPALEGLLTDGAAGDEVRSDALAAGDDAQAWILWFLLRPDCLVVATPVAGLRPDAVDDAVVRCNAYNRGLRWSVLSVAPWDGDQVATLSARVPLPPGEAGRWEAIGGAMEAVLRDAGPARSATRPAERHSTAVRRGLGFSLRPALATGRPSTRTTSAVKSLDPRSSEEPTP
jgi:hypothetical protein